MTIMKKMIFSLIAAMMLLGTVNSNAQRNVRNDRPRQEMRKDADRRPVTLVRAVSTRLPTPL
mgnify:CR=1 FL=1|jgi:hypothetical protein